MSRHWQQWTAIGCAAAALISAFIVNAAGFSYGPLIPWAFAIAAVVFGILGFIRGALAKEYVGLPLVGLIVGLLAIAPAAFSTATARSEGDCWNTDVDFWNSLLPRSEKLGDAIDAAPSAESVAQMPPAAMVASQSEIWTEIIAMGAIAEQQPTCTPEAARLRSAFITRATWAKRADADANAAVIADDPEAARTALVSFAAKMNDSQAELQGAEDDFLAIYGEDQGR